MENSFQIADEIRDALKDRKPVVALESSVIAHGLPYPRNREVAVLLQSVIRDAGAVPATIAVLDGVIRVGLDYPEIERLASGSQIAKLATRDLPLAIVDRMTGGTTVSATAWIASRAGIEVFVTGGIGGVHSGAGKTMDVSSDLWELARTSIIVVSAGAKAIVDLRATLEWLESHQVGVYGYRTAEFPAFYSRHSGLEVDMLEGPKAVASVYVMRRRLGLPGSMVIGVPPPDEYDLDVSEEVHTALEKAEAVGIKGKALTPWLLACIAELTDGRSVQTNVAILKNNALVGAEVASALVRLRS